VTGPAGLGGLSIEAARRRLAREFRARGLETPELDARVLIGHGLGLEHAALAAAASRVLTAGEADTIGALAARRVAREPVARIIGRKEFWALPFKLNADTLLPRPETETVVEAALAALAADNCRPRSLRIADLGTGSGALLLALLSELPSAVGTGTDISRDAVECARENARALGLCTRASFVICDYAAALKGPFDLVVSNPPYVARPALAGLQPEVRDFDPHRALDGGPDGLDGYRAIAAQARHLLAPEGLLVLELGADQSDQVKAIFGPLGLAPAGRRHDLAGIVRALVLRALP
jgi:release factor glutamine methyltransferase